MFHVPVDVFGHFCLLQATPLRGLLLSFGLDEEEVVFGPSGGHIGEIERERGFIHLNVSPADNLRCFRNLVTATWAAVGHL